MAFDIRSLLVSCNIRKEQRTIEQKIPRESEQRSNLKVGSLHSYHAHSHYGRQALSHLFGTQAFVTHRAV